MIQPLLVKKPFLKILLEITLVLALLYFGRTLFVPLFFAVLVSFIIYPFCRWLERKGFSRVLAIAAGLLVASIPICGIAYVFIAQLFEIGNHYGFLQQKLHVLLSAIDPGLGKHFSAHPGQGDFLRETFLKNTTQVYKGLLTSFSVLLQVVLVPFYTALILYHRKGLLRFFQSFFPAGEAARVHSIIEEIVVTYYNFIKGMLLVYLIVGTLNSVALFLLGIPNSFIYGFTASILTFIPYIGIIVGSIMPVIAAWAMNDGIFYPLGVIASFTFVQFLEANLIFPLAVSYRIKVNTLFTLLAIFLGAIIWGAAGMILFIPFVAILKLVAEKIPRLKPLADVLGE